MASLIFCYEVDEIEYWKLKLKDKELLNYTTFNFFTVVVIHK